VISDYDWALREYGCVYGVPIVTDQNGTKYEPNTYSKEQFILPDGTYHVEWEFSMPGDGVQLVDPDSDFAKDIMAKNPDVVFTDQSKGIDFTVKDGKPDRSLQFNFMPEEDLNNQLTVNCIDAMTGKPLAGAKLSLMLDPRGEGKILESWTSDETGSKHFENLKISGRPSYKVKVDEMPEGYTGTFNMETSTAYWGYRNKQKQILTLKFMPEKVEKNISFNIIKWEDKSLFNEAATYGIWSVDGSSSGALMGSVRAGEKFALPDGKYLAILNGKELLDTEYTTISSRSVSGKKIFEENNWSIEDYLLDTGLVIFTVEDGKPDRDLAFYVKQQEPDDDENALVDINYDIIRKYFYGIE
jgi:hypothetical protein